MRKFLFLILLAAPVFAQPINSGGGGITTGTSLPATCTVGQAYGLTSGAKSLYYCTATNVWTPRTITATFLVCAGPCTANETSNWKWSAPFGVTFTGCVIDAQTYPTGAAITVDVLKAGTTTIFSSTVPTLAAGSSSFSTQTGMAASAALNQGDYLVAKVLTVGSTQAGQYVNLVCTGAY